MSSLFRKFVLDASVLISAKQKHYKFCDCPEFWQFLIKSHLGGRIVSSIDKVRDEIAKQKDELHAWALEAPRTFFASTAGATIPPTLYAISDRLERMEQYTPEAIDEFMQTADSSLIAFAKVVSSTVVTQEKRRDNATTRVHIPSVCAIESIPCMNMLEMIEELKFRPDDWRDTP